MKTNKNQEMQDANDKLWQNIMDLLREMSFHYPPEELRDRTASVMADMALEVGEDDPNTAIEIGNCTMQKLYEEAAGISPANIYSRRGQHN